MVIILCICICIISSIMQKPTNYIEESKVIDSIEIEDDKAFFYFIGDSKVYIVHESNGVDLDKLNTIWNNTAVRIKLEDIKHNSVYTIIYTLTIGDTTIFDVIDYYQNNHRLKFSIFTSLPTVMLLVILGFIFMWKNPPANTADAFIVKGGRWIYELFTCFTAMGVAFFLNFLIFYIMETIPLYTFVIGFIGLFYVAIGVLGLTLVINECFSYSNGVYKYVSSFRKITIMNVADIQVVNIGSNKRNVVEYSFIGKDDRMLVKFTGNLQLIRGSFFLISLRKNKIKVNNLANFCIPA